MDELIEAVYPAESIVDRVSLLSHFDALADKGATHILMSDNTLVPLDGSGSVDDVVVLRSARVGEAEGYYWTSHAIGEWDVWGDDPDEIVYIPLATKDETK